MNPAKSIAVRRLSRFFWLGTVVAKCCRALPEFRGIGREHSAFTERADDLVVAEREGGCVPKRPHRATSVSRTLGLGAVFYQKQIPLVGKLHERVHIARTTAEMNGNDCSRFRSENRANRVNCQVLSVAIDIRKDRSGSDHCNTAPGRNERTDARDNLIPGLNPSAA